MLPAHGFLNGVKARALEYENCTGATINMQAVSYGGWSTELNIDLGAVANSGARIYDAYMCYPSSSPIHPCAQPLLFTPLPLPADNESLIHVHPLVRPKRTNSVLAGPRPPEYPTTRVLNS